MAVGTQSNAGNINQTLTNLALALRNDVQDILNLQQYLNGATGLGLAGLEALGYSAADAQVVLSMANYMATIAQVYNGTATQASLFNFGSALTPLWGGQ